MSPKCCCCFPLRLGVLIFTFLTFVINGAVGGFAWFVLFAADKVDNPEYQALVDSQRTAIIVTGAVFSAQAVVGLVGFLGAIFKKKWMVRTYLIVLVALWLLQVASTIYQLIMFFKYRNQSLEDCLGSSPSDTKKTLCDSIQELKKIHPAAMIALNLIPHIFTVWMIVIVRQYIDRLKKQEMEEWNGRHSRSAPHYVPAKRAEEAHPLTQPTVVYPYSDSPNAFGSNTAAHKA